MLTNLLSKVFRIKTRDNVVIVNFDTLDKKVRNILSSLEGNKAVIPYEDHEYVFSFSGGTTKGSYSREPFILNSPATIQTYKYKHKPADTAIVRIVVPYDMAEKVLFDDSILTSFLRQAFRYAKLETDKILGIDSIKPLYGKAYLSPQEVQVGENKLVLYESPAHGGYEIRFFSQCKN